MFMNQGAELRHKIGKLTFRKVGGGGIQGSKKKGAGKKLRMKGAVKTEPGAAKRARTATMTMVGSKTKMSAAVEEKVTTAVADAFSLPAKPPGKKKSLKLPPKPQAAFLSGGSKASFSAKSVAEKQEEGGSAIDNTPAALSAREAIMKKHYAGKGEAYYTNWTMWQVMRSLLATNYVNSAQFCDACDSWECEHKVFERVSTWQNLRPEKPKDNLRPEDDDLDSDFESEINASDIEYESDLNLESSGNSQSSATSGISSEDSGTSCDEADADAIATTTLDV